jgi:hypothetical protein
MNFFLIYIFFLLCWYSFGVGVSPGHGVVRHPPKRLVFAQLASHRVEVLAVKLVRTEIRLLVAVLPILHEGDLGEGQLKHANKSNETLHVRFRTDSLHDVRLGELIAVLHRRQELVGTNRWTVIFGQVGRTVGVTK